MSLVKLNVEPEVSEVPASLNYKTCLDIVLSSKNEDDFDMLICLLAHTDITFRSGQCKDLAMRIINRLPTWRTRRAMSLFRITNNKVIAVPAKQAEEEMKNTSHIRESVTKGEILNELRRKFENIVTNHKERLKGLCEILASKLPKE